MPSLEKRSGLPDLFFFDKVILNYHQEITPKAARVSKAAQTPP